MPPLMQLSGTASFKKMKLASKKTPEKAVATRVDVQTPSKDAQASLRASVKLFRKECGRFAHPSEFHTKTGLTLPSNCNYANLFRSTVMNSPPKPSDGGVVRFLMSYAPIPSDAHACRIVQSLKAVKGRFLSYDTYALASRDTWELLQPTALPTYLAGLLHLNSNKQGHMVFYEACPLQRTVRVLDPNAHATGRWADQIATVFVGFSITWCKSYGLNTNDTAEQNPAVHAALQQMGFTSAGDMQMAGYCQSIALFYLYDYLCTKQWTRATAEDDHFFRASQDWLYSDAELKHETAGPLLLAVRCILFARYLAYKLADMMQEHTFRLPSNKKIHGKDRSSLRFTTIAMRPSTIDGQTINASFVVTPDGFKEHHVVIKDKARDMNDIYKGLGIGRKQDVVRRLFTD